MSSWLDATCMWGLYEPFNTTNNGVISSVRAVAVHIRGITAKMSFSSCVNFCCFSWKYTQVLLLGPEILVSDLIFLLLIPSTSNWLPVIEMILGSVPLMLSSFELINYQKYYCKKYFSNCLQQSWAYVTSSCCLRHSFQHHLPEVLCVISFLKEVKC